MPIFADLDKFVTQRCKNAIFADQGLLQYEM